jgi:hypothetical protein
VRQACLFEVMAGDAIGVFIVYTAAPDGLACLDLSEFDGS